MVCPGDRVNSFGGHRLPVRGLDEPEYVGRLLRLGGNEKRGAVTKGRDGQLEILLQLRHAFAMGHQDQVAPGDLVRQRIVPLQLISQSSPAPTVLNMYPLVCAVRTIGLL